VTGSLQSPEQRVMTDSFLQGLRERGYVEEQNIVIEYRAADGQIARFTELAKELVDLNPDLIVASNTPAARAAKHATTTIPLARPGDNVTGFALYEYGAMMAKGERYKQPVALAAW
jgi:putative ABC transport system substrate-binding protein